MSTSIGVVELDSALRRRRPNAPGRSRESLHFDHIIPIALGGANCAENIELLCRSCNLKKGIGVDVPG